ncbi:deoxyribose-phosphate aldolase [Microvirga thermotolerans]|uniref:Deoxyribose-phosphate aldolase n=1 Tax=Microvirga thermotolerans TaxID=2651334 RepID=A0A5P9JYW5_9HYPH|nr:deoxyribose-phosphate aldolase [Microvirga thermotolerans]QFU17449.1 deoxyribose-phosphate aldolase [Microvirga thermotolerans]
MSDASLAQRALRCLDLTDLTDNCTDQAIDALCAKALDPRGPVAAVCVWPQFVGRAREALRGSPVRVATVVNFPAGGEDVERVTDDVREALSDGANEVDLVLPYEALRRGDRAVASDMVEAVREVVDQGRTLKVILETGMLAEPALIAEASRLAIEAGADFIKTSTGKTPVSATPQAAEIMLHAIRDSGRPVGLKPSGGIRTLADAKTYLDLADRIMGPDWATPKTFRIGASSVFDALIAAIEGRAGSAPAGVY